MSGERCGGASKPLHHHLHKPPSFQAKVVRPEPVLEKSFVENVTGFINEVTPQSSGNPCHYDDKESIEWVKFEQCDLTDPSLASDPAQPLPLLLILGYNKGVQGWLVPSNGEAEEVFSWRRCSVRCLKVLPSPLVSSQPHISGDLFSDCRPLIALCDATTVAPTPFSVLAFQSIRTAEEVKTYKFQHTIVNIEANRRVVVVVFPERLAVLCAASLEERFTVASCYLAPAPNVNPVCLGEMWLAYGERRLHSHYTSGGGASSEGSHSYKTTVLQYAKTLSKGVLDFKDTVTSILSSSAPRSASSSVSSGSGGGAGSYAAGGGGGTVLVPHSPSPPPPTAPSQHGTPGILTVLDVESVPYGPINLSESSVPGVVAHFVAHNSGSPIVAVQFDPSGCLVFTADQLGHFFHLFRIQPHPLAPALGAVHHLYTLHRGDTTAKVIDMSFSFDSRWVAVSTHRGTTHVFPITPYGGDITARTHTSLCVVNRQSRYERSARLDDNPSPSGRNSPLVGSAGSASGTHHHYLESSACPTLAYPNPRLPPYPFPALVSPYVQLRQPLLHNLLGSIGASPTPPRPPGSARTSPYPEVQDIVKVASVFAPPRGWVAGSPSMLTHTPPQSSVTGFGEGGPATAGTTTDALFVMAYHGNLIQYSLQPRPVMMRQGEKPTASAHIQLEMHAVAQWSLVRATTSNELRPPLPPVSPLLHLPPRFNPTPPHHHSLHTAFSPNTSPEEAEHSWPGELDITTHSGPDRHNSLGPQFVLQPHTAPTYSTPSPYTEGDPSSRMPRSSPVDIQGCGRGTPIVLEASSFGSGSYSASPSLVERMSGLHMGSCGDITSQIQQGISDALHDDPSLSRHASGGRGDGGGGRYYDYAESHQGHLIEDYEGPYGTFVGRRTPSLTSRWSGSSRSLEDVEQQPTSAGSGSRTRQMSATQYPVQPQYPLQYGSHASMQSPPPLYSGHTSASFDESKGMTSSAEELSTTLVSGTRFRDSLCQTSAGQTAESGQSQWVPIDVPYTEIHPTLAVHIERPEPTKASKTHIAKDTQSKRSPANIEIEKEFLSDLTGCDAAFADVPSEPGYPWGNPSAEDGATKPDTDKPTLVLTLDKKPPEKNKNVKSSAGFSGANTGTSDDDLMAVDTKKERKKKKRRGKNSGDGLPSADVLISASSVLDNSASDSIKSDECRNVESVSIDRIRERDACAEESIAGVSVGQNTYDTSFSSALIDTVAEDSLDINVDHFKDSPEESEPATLPVSLCVDENEVIGNVNLTSLETFRQSSVEDQSDDHNVIEETYDEDGNFSKCSKPKLVDNLDDFELQEEEDAENGNEGTGAAAGAAMLISVHSEEDLARALEEACSDEDAAPRHRAPRATSSSTGRRSARAQRVSELFPYRVSSSDEESKSRDAWPALTGGGSSSSSRARSVDTSGSGVAPSTTTNPGASVSTDDMSTDDRGETSGDDKRGTGSDSSSNATATHAKSKKKRKKRR